MYIIGKPGVRILAEALEKSDRVSHVYVHIGGKIEALGEIKTIKGHNSDLSHTTTAAATQNMHTNESKSNDSTNTNNTASIPPSIGTICIVDVRENNPILTDTLYYQLQALEAMNFQRQQGMLNLANTAANGGPEQTNTTANTTTNNNGNSNGNGSNMTGINGMRQLRHGSLTTTTSSSTNQHDALFSGLNDNLSMGRSLPAGSIGGGGGGSISSNSVVRKAKKSGKSGLGPALVNSSGSASAAEIDDKRNKTKVCVYVCV